MPEVDRRRFLQLTGGSAALSVLTPVDRPRGVDPGEPPDRLHRRRRAHRRPDAGEPLVRPLLRHDARRARLRRPAPGRAAQRRVGVAPAARRRRRCCRSGPTATDLGLAVPPGPRPRLGQPATRRSTAARYDRWVPAKGAPTTMAHLTRGDIPFHYALADAFTVCDAYHCCCSGPTTPTATTCGPAGWATTARAAARWSATSEPGFDWTTYPERLEKAGVTWKIYQDVGDGLDAAGAWGWTSSTPTSATTATTRCSTSSNTSNAAPGDPLYDERPHRHERQAPAQARSSTCSPPTSQAEPAAAGLLDRRAGGLHRAPELAGQLRRLVRLAGARRADQRTPRCGPRPRCSSPTTRTTASSTTWCRRTPASARCQGALDGRHSTNELYRGKRRRRRRALRAGRPRCR